MLLFDVIPQVQQGQEIAGRVGKSGVKLVCLLAFSQWALSRILNGQPGNNHHHLTHQVVIFRLEQHSGESWLHRQLRQTAPDIGELDRFARTLMDGAQLGQ